MQAIFRELAERFMLKMLQRERIRCSKKKHSSHQISNPARAAKPSMPSVRINFLFLPPALECVFNFV
jgi:hypothetical protein